MLEQVLGLDGPLLHHPLVRRASGGLPESPDEMSGRHAASLAEFVGGRRGADSGEQNFLGDALLPRREPAPGLARDRRYVRIIMDQVRHQQNSNFIDKKLRALFGVLERK